MKRCTKVQHYTSGGGDFMMTKKEIAIVGAGSGGKQPYVGSRTSEIKLGEYKFDMGPTFLNCLYCRGNF